MYINIVVYCLLSKYHQQAMPIKRRSQKIKTHIKNSIHYTLGTASKIRTAASGACGCVPLALQT